MGGYWSSDFYSDIFSLDFDSSLNTIDLENLGSNENSHTIRESERVVLAETTNNLPAPDESRFPLTSTDQIQETIKEAQNKNTERSTNMWYSLAKSRQINESVETMAPATLDRVLQKFYLEVRKQDGSEYEPDSFKVMQAALERYLSSQKYTYSLINSLKFSSSKQVRMYGYGKPERIAPCRATLPKKSPSGQVVC